MDPSTEQENSNQVVMITWAPDLPQDRSFICTFCKKGFSNAQALGGHMNVHRRDRAKLHQNLLSLDISRTITDTQDGSASPARLLCPDEKVGDNVVGNEGSPHRPATVRGGAVVRTYRYPPAYGGSGSPR